jgi:uncharacterized lipoprotein YmbA
MTPTPRPGLAMIAAALLLTGCGSYPLPTVYALGDPGPATPDVASDAGRPVFDLRTVTAPDDVDTTDILRSEGANRVVASPTGRWAERVSVGVTQALAAALSRRLPDVVIETRSAYEAPRRILVDIDRFEIGSSGRCLIAARWGITGADGKTGPWSDQGTFVETATSGTDAAAAAAMTLAANELADHIAITVRQTLTGPPK